MKLPYALKIPNEVRSRAFLKVDGASGLLYQFVWDQKLRCYVYHPKEQKEVDDLFRTVGRRYQYRTFVPFVPSHEIQPPVSQPQGVPPAPPELRDQATQRGIKLLEDDTEATVTRLMVAYDRGLTDALESMPTLRRQKPHKKEAVSEAVPA